MSPFRANGQPAGNRSLSAILKPACLESTPPAAMDIVQIMSILPHRYPLLLIDRVLED